MWNVQFKIIKQVKTLGHWWNWEKSFTIKYHWVDWYWTWYVYKRCAAANKSPITLFSQNQWKTSFTNWWIKVGYSNMAILVVEFSREGFKIRKVFGWKSTLFKWNHWILRTSVMGKCQKVPKFDSIFYLIQ